MFLSGSAPEMTFWVDFPGFFDVLDDICAKLHQNNVFTVARRNVEGQELLYHSLKFTNGVWVLSELKLQPGNASMTVLLEFILYPGVL